MFQYIFYNFQVKSGPEDISLKLRPTLPKKQLEIPRFSPSAAWRLLSALEAPGPTMSTASEEVPVNTLKYSNMTINTIASEEV